MFACRISHSYLACVTKITLRRHLSNMNVIRWISNVNRYFCETKTKGRIMPSFDVYLFYTLLNKQSIYRWFDTPWHPCHVTVLIPLTVPAYLGRDVGTDCDHTGSDVLHVRTTRPGRQLAQLRLKHKQVAGQRLNTVRPLFTGRGVRVIKIRGSWDRLIIFMTVIPVLVRRLFCKISVWLVRDSSLR